MVWFNLLFKFSLIILVNDSHNVLRLKNENKKTINFKILLKWKINIKDQILKNSIVAKRIEYFKNFTEENEDQSLLQTIRIPKNLLFLSDKLPQPNYERPSNKNHSFTKKNNNDLPDIRGLNIRKKIKKRETNPEIPDIDEAENRINPQISSIKKVKRSVKFFFCFFKKFKKFFDDSFKESLNKFRD